MGLSRICTVSEALCVLAVQAKIGQRRLNTKEREREGKRDSERQRRVCDAFMCVSVCRHTHTKGKPYTHAHNHRHTQTHT
jgi:hypothetical protein